MGPAFLYYVRSDGVDEEQVRGRYGALLLEEERARCARYVFEKDRRTGLLARALVRLLLSRHAAGVDPRDWRFVEGPHGRPEIAAGPAGAPALRFNLSHTAGMVACVVARGREVGVDVEDCSRRSPTLEIAERFFAPLEVAALRALPAAEVTERFFAFWTLKESYCKARGLGLSLPLSSYAFELAADGAVRLHMEPRVGDRPERWRFLRLAPTSRHRVAVALERLPGEEEDAALQIRELEPLDL